MASLALTPSFLIAANISFDGLRRSISLSSRGLCSTVTLSHPEVANPLAHRAAAEMVPAVELSCNPQYFPALFTEFVGSYS